MNVCSFADLIYEIFRSRPPDITKIEKKGLLAVKIGQMFALRIDFLSPETCNALAALYQNTSEIPSEEFQELLNAHVALGEDNWRDFFHSIEEEPVASASVGQVHRARLVSGEAVVVKLLKQDFTSKFKKDVETVTRLFRMVTIFYPKLNRVANPLALLEMIKEDTLAELDLTNEIQNQTILKDIRDKHTAAVNLENLEFPRMYADLSSVSVLVAEEILGDTLETLLQEKRLAYTQLKRLFRIHGFYMFGEGIFHGDLHPGNVMLNGDTFYFVDCGAIGRVSDKMRRGLFQFMKSLSFYDFPACATALHSMSDRRLTDKRYQIFLAKFLDLYKDFPGKTVAQVSLTEQMMHTIKLGVHHGMIFEKGMFPIIKSLMYMDGMVLQCNPDAILMEDMREFIPQLENYVV